MPFPFFSRPLLSPLFQVFSRLFALDTESGLLRVSEMLNHEEIVEYRLTIDAYNPTQVLAGSSTALVIIEVLSMNDNAPQFVNIMELFWNWIGFHAFRINLYLHLFFELNTIAYPHWLWPMVRKGNLAKFEKEQISKTGEAMPSKIGLHAFHNNLYI